MNALEKIAAKKKLASLLKKKRSWKKPAAFALGGAALLAMNHHGNKIIKAEHEYMNRPENIKRANNMLATYSKGLGKTPADLSEKEFSRGFRGIRSTLQDEFIADYRKR